MRKAPPHDFWRLVKAMSALLDESTVLSSAPDDEGEADGARRRAKASMTLLKARDVYEKLEGLRPPKGGEGEPIKLAARLVIVNALCGFMAEAESLYARLLGKARLLKRRISPRRRKDCPLPPREIFRAGALAMAACQLSVAYLKAGRLDAAVAVFLSMEPLAVGEPALSEFAFCAEGLIRETVKDRNSGRAMQIFDVVARVAGRLPLADRLPEARLTLVGGVPDTAPEGVAEGGGGKEPAAVSGSSAEGGGPLAAENPSGAAGAAGFSGASAGSGASGQAPEGLSLPGSSPEASPSGLDGGGLPAPAGGRAGPGLSWRGEGSLLRAAEEPLREATAERAARTEDPGGKGAGKDNSGKDDSAQEGSGARGPGEALASGDGLSAGAPGSASGRWPPPAGPHVPFLTLVPSQGGPEAFPESLDEEAEEGRSASPGENFWLAAARICVNCISVQSAGGNPDEARRNRVARGRPEDAIRIYGFMATLPDSGPIRAYRAFALVNLVNCCCEWRMYAEALDLYMGLPSLGDGPEFLSARARGDRNLVLHYCEEGWFSKAMTVLAAMEGLSGGPLIEIEKAEALSFLIRSLGKRGHFKEALELYGKLTSSYGDGPQINRIRAEEAVSLIRVGCEAHDFAAAKAVYEGMDAFGAGESQAAMKGKALYNLVNHLLSPAGSRKEALEYFKDLESMGYPGLSGSEKGLTCFRLITSLGSNGMLEEALEVYAALKRSGGSDEEEAFERSKACVNLTGFLSNAGRIGEARELYRETLLSGWPPAAAVNLAMSAYNLVDAFSKARDFASAAEILAGMELFGASPEAAEMRAQSAQSLIRELAADGRAEEAAGHLRGMESRGVSEKAELCRARAMVDLVGAYCAKGALAEAVALYEGMDFPCLYYRLRKELARAACRLCAAFLKAGDLKSAEAFMRSLADLGDEDGVRSQRSKAAISLADFYCSLGRLRQARKTLAMAYFRSFHEEDKIRKGKVAFNLAVGLVKAGRIGAARELLNDRKFFPEYPEELRLTRARLGLVLVKAFAEAGRFGEAEQLLRRMESLGSSQEVETLRESALSELNKARSALDFSVTLAEGDRRPGE
jgi:pentatricopeptide repeat protein